MSDLKTTPTTRSVNEFLEKISDEQKRGDSQTLIAMMRDISGCEPVLWGSSIIGFDSFHYKYDSGKEGDICALGFSPRKAGLTIYINEGFDAHGDLLTDLGKYTTSVSCLYIKRLADIDMGVLRQLIERSYDHLKQQRPKPATVAEYETSVPGAAMAVFRQLRSLVKSVMPHAEEVISYAIPAYKIDEKRPVVYISAWKDHVAIYPVPSNKQLQVALRPYIKGKGTLWFPLDEPLPKDLIRKVIQAHLAERAARP